MKYKFRGHVIDMDDIDRLIQTAKDRMKEFTRCSVCSKYDGSRVFVQQCSNCPVLLISRWCGDDLSWFSKFTDIYSYECKDKLLIQRKKYWQRIKREILKKGELIK